MNRSSLSFAGCLVIGVLSILALCLPSNLYAQARSAETLHSTAPAGYRSSGDIALSFAQRASVELGAEHLSGAAVQSLAASILYATSVASFAGGIATTLVFFAEFAPLSGMWGVAEFAVFGAILACVAVGTISLPLAIGLDRGAQVRRRRAREELLLDVSLSPLGVALTGRFG